jgi:hypothetical protein
MFALSVGHYLIPERAIKKPGISIDTGLLPFT